jgi:hypothetical protein
MFVCLFLFFVFLFFVCLFVSNAQGTRGLGISSRKSTRSAFASGRMEVPPTTQRATQHHRRRAHRRPCTTRTRSTKQRRLLSFSEQQLAVVYRRLPDVMLQLRSSYSCSHADFALLCRAAKSKHPASMSFYNQLLSSETPSALHDVSLHEVGAPCRCHKSWA